MSQRSSQGSGRTAPERERSRQEVRGYADFAFGRRRGPEVTPAG